ncbi:MAG: hypothetical protein ACLGQH_05100 [Acidobacteriota bacterium]
MPVSEAQSSNEAASTARRRCRQALWWTIAVSLLAAPLDCYEYIIYAYLPGFCYSWGPFLTVVLELGTWAYAIFIAIRYCWRQRLRSLYPLIIMVAVHYALGEINPYDRNINSYHAAFREEREYLVKAFCAKEISLQRTYCDHCFVLPRKWKHLAVADGVVEITCDYNRQTGLFLTIRGLLDSWHGLMYQSDDSPPDAPNIADAYEITKIGKNWFYINH